MEVMLNNNTLQLGAAFLIWTEWQLHLYDTLSIELVDKNINLILAVKLFDMFF
jgi:hypothetical protein